MQVPLLKIAQVSSFLITLTACSSTTTHHRIHHPRVDTSAIIQTAQTQLGADYAYGGDSPDEGFDCSGLVYYSFRQAGITLPRTTYGQFRRTQAVSRVHLRRGDLVFFRVNRSGYPMLGSIWETIVLSMPRPLVNPSQLPAWTAHTGESDISGQDESMAPQL